MPCPFLTRLSTTYVRNYGTTLLKTYGQHCPVMSRLASNVASTDSNAVGSEGGERQWFIFVFMRHCVNQLMCMSFLCYYGAITPFILQLNNMLLLFQL